jgi:mutator protein MutT
MLNLNRKKVIAGLIKKGNTILIAQRAKKDSLYGKWEFPGGKMEQGETEQECLQRELYEEFGIKAEIGDYFCTIPFEHKSQPMEMMVFFVPAFSGEIILHEHSQIKWVEKNSLLHYEFPEPDKPVIQKLLTYSHI